jgi:DNA-binding response OmpR family regulator
MAQVLVVEDDATIRSSLIRGLTERGHAVLSAPTAMAGLEQAVSARPDVVVLDLGLPDLDGTAMLRMLRGVSAVPVVVATARDDEAEIVAVLDAGADDYVVKPFGTRELLARIRAMLRRSTQGFDAVLSFADVEVDLDQRVVRRSGEETRMTRAEFNLLAFFLQNPGRALSRDVILNSVWGYESFPNTRTVDAHVVRLRQKLEPEPEIPRHFLTMHGVGYRFLP